MPNRPETGPMQFENDWTGVFLRGDCAFAYKQALSVVLDKNSDHALKAMAEMTLRSLLQLLTEAHEHEGDKDIRQMLKPFQECLPTTD